MFWTIFASGDSPDCSEQQNRPSFPEFTGVFSGNHKDGVLEVWLVNINDQCVEAYWEPISNGYCVVQRYGRGQYLSIQALPEIAIAVNDVLG